MRCICALIVGFAWHAIAVGQPAAPWPAPASPVGERTIPLSLPEALKFAGSRPLDIAIAGQRVEAATKRYDLAKLQWVPNIVVGADWFHHEGRQQNFAGEILTSNRSTVMAGVGPNVVFSFSEALFAPKITAQELAAWRSQMTATTNDLTAAVAEAYFEVQRARGELAGAELAATQAAELSRRATALAEGLSPPLEATRARVELARRKQAAAAARERWQVASAELIRLLRLDAGGLVEPAEPPFLTVSLIDDASTADLLVPIALQNRPELLAHQALVQATLARLKQEKLRPLLPSLAVRSVSTNPSGSIGYGTFAGGPGGRLGNAGQRFDVDVQLMWEFSNLGLGNRAKVGERNAEHFAATLELFRTQDRIAAEVATEFARLKAAAERVALAEPAAKDSIELVEKSLVGLSQTRRQGDTIVLVVRPQEAVAAVQSLGQSAADLANAVADFNRAQFRLYRALGHPAAALPNAVGIELPPPPKALTPAGMP
jgi:outer membrane protein TolC